MVQTVFYNSGAVPLSLSSKCLNLQHLSTVNYSVWSSKVLRQCFRVKYSKIPAISPNMVVFLQMKNVCLFYEFLNLKLLLYECNKVVLCINFNFKKLNADNEFSILCTLTFCKTRGMHITNKSFPKLSFHDHINVCWERFVIK